MCLGVPGRVTRKYDTNGIPMGTVDFGGVRREVCLAYVPDIEPGEFAIVHVGFAITQLDEQAAAETLAFLKEIGALDEELGLEAFGSTGGSDAPAVVPDAVDPKDAS